MSIQEFSDEFDILVASYAHKNLFGEESSQLDLNFDEYEKSVFLTQAQEAAVKNIYSSKATDDAFEYSEADRRQIESLVVTKIWDKSEEDYDILATIVENKEKNTTEYKDNYIHTVYKLPSDCWYIAYEQATLGGDDTCIKGKIVDVIPVTHDTYRRTVNNPFRGPNTRKVLRLDKGNTKVELVSKYDISQYLIRYLKRPEPIILVNLDGVSINNQIQSQTCKLSDSLHRTILEIAVQIAIKSRLGNSNTNNK